MRLWLLPILASCASSDGFSVADDRPRADPPLTDDTDAPVDTDDTDAPIDTDTPTPPDTVTDAFTYQPPVVDVLFVIDASGSMLPFTETLIGSVPTLMTAWLDKGLAFRAGVTNIDEGFEHGRLVEVGGRKWAAPTQPNPDQTLMGLLDAVNDPSAVESGRAAAYKAIEWSAPGEPNEGFLRDDSQLAVIVHTDENDQSGPTPVSQEDFIAYLNALRPQGRVAFHSIASSPDYTEITAAVGGVSWGVFNTPYFPPLQAITDSFVRTRLELSEAAVEDTLVAHVVEPDMSEAEVVPPDIRYDANAMTVVFIGYVPQPGATVEITYEPAK